MHFVGVLLNVVLLLVLIFRIFVALFEGVVALQPTKVAGLKSLVVTLEGTLVVLLVILFVVVVVTVTVAAILWLVVLTVHVITVGVI
jgi:hypothetical protein